LRLEIELANVTKHFGSTLAVDNVSLKLTGKINLLLGSNGSGKSTLINTLAGVTYPNKGILSFDGLEFDAKSKKSWRVGTEKLRRKSRFWLDNPGLPQTLTGRDLLKFEKQQQRQNQKNASNRSADDELSKIADNSFGQSLDLDKPISSYSSGMKQKLGIMATLLGDPEFVVWDEPTATLDAGARATVVQLAKEYAARGTTFLIASHIPGDFEGVADWVGLMRLGQLLKSGKISEVGKADSKDYSIETDFPVLLAAKLLELDMALSVSIVDGSVVAKATEKFDQSKLEKLSKDLGATKFSVRKRQKSISELYMEAIG
jgi:ABC-type multidrug transport system ATPase subunit